jgi:hypothetical protein
MDGRNEVEDRNAFIASLAIFDRPEEELRTKCLPPATDVDAFLAAAFKSV